MPVLMPEQHCRVRSSWIAKLAQAFARDGQHTVVVDAARSQIAAALGLRARFDLAHVWLGDCELETALVDAGPQLAILPAARALPKALARGSTLAAELAVLGPALAERGGCDLALPLLTAGSAALLRGLEGDLLVPIVPTALEFGQALRDIERVAEVVRRVNQEHPLSLGLDCRASLTFRLLFLGMDPQAAATLAQRVSASLRADVQPAGAVQIARDLARVVRAADGWSLARTESKPWAA